jgi:hypothetical protein
MFVAGHGQAQGPVVRIQWLAIHSRHYQHLCVSKVRVEFRN